VAVDAFERLVAVAPDVHWRAILWAGWLAGLRIGESYSLEWEPTEKAPWVDLSRDRIWLPAELAQADEDQWVPLDRHLRAILEALPGPRKGKVFRLLTRDGRRPALSTVSDRIVRMAKKAGVKLSSHSLRKGFGCRYASKVSTHVLQRLMRH